MSKRTEKGHGNGVFVYFLTPTDFFSENSKVQVSYSHIKIHSN